MEPASSTVESKQGRTGLEDCPPDEVVDQRCAPCLSISSSVRFRAG